MTTPKSSKFSEVLLVDSRSSGIPSFPSTPAIAKANLEKFLAEKLAEGWIYHAELSQNISAEVRKYWVFYR